jgi:uncharacterized protein YciW
MSSAERAYAAADAWRALADAAQDAWAKAGGIAGALTANNSGAAVDAFEQKWKELSSDASGCSLARLVQRCTSLAESCEHYAVRLGTPTY